MSADSFHKRVEGEMKKMDTVYDFDDFTQCVDTRQCRAINCDGTV